MNKKLKALGLVLVPVLIIVGCSTFTTNVFRLQQTSENLAYAAYVGWTNYMAIHPVSADASNAVKRARLEFAATDGVIDQLRASYDTNSAVKPQLQAAVQSLSDNASNIVWLVKYFQASH